MDENLIIQRHTLHVLKSICVCHTDFLKDTVNLSLTMDAVYHLLSKDTNDS